MAANASFWLDAKLRLVSPKDIGGELSKIFARITSKKFNLNIDAKLNTLRDTLRKAKNLKTNIVPRAGTLIAGVRAALKDVTFKIKVDPTLTTTTLKRRGGAGIASGASAQAKGAATLSANLDRASKSARQLGKDIPLSPMEELQRSGGSAGDRIAQSMGFAAGTTKAFGVTVGLVLRRFAAFAIASKLLLGLQNSVSQALRSLREFNQGMADLQKVSLEARRDTEFFIQSQISLAKRFAVTISSVQELQLEFARQGRTAQETAALTESALLAMNSAGLTAQESIELLTIAVNVFGIAALESSSIIDKLTSLADSNAVTVQDLTEAFRRSASVFEAVNLTFEESASLLTIVREQTRLSASRIGTAFKSIIPSIVNTKDQIEALGVSTQNALGEFDFIKTIQGLKELFDRPEFTGERVIRISTELVGKRQVARFLGLISGIANLEEDLAIQALSAGNALEKQSIQLDTFNSIVQNLNNSVFGLVKSIADLGFGDVFATAVKGATGLINIFSSIFGALGKINKSGKLFVIALLGIKLIFPILKDLAFGAAAFTSALLASRGTAEEVATGVNKITGASEGMVIALQQAQAQLASMRNEAEAVASATQKISTKGVTQTVGAAGRKERTGLVTPQQEAEDYKRLTSSINESIDAIERKKRATPVRGATQLFTREVAANKELIPLIQQRINSQKALLTTTIQQFGITKPLQDARTKAIIKEIQADERKLQLIKEINQTAIGGAQRTAEQGLGQENIRMALAGGSKITKQQRGILQLFKDQGKEHLLADRQHLQAVLQAGSIQKANQLGLLKGLQVEVGLRTRATALAKNLLGSVIARQAIILGTVNALSSVLEKTAQENAAVKETLKVTTSIANTWLTISFIKPDLGLKAAFGWAIAIVVALKVITELINPPETKLEKSLRATKEALDKSIKSAVKLRSTLSELASTDPDDIRKRVQLTDELIAQNSELIAKRSQLLSLNQAGLNDLKKEIEFDKIIIKNLEKKSKQLRALATGEDAILQKINEQKKKRKLSIVVGFALGVGLVATTLFSGGTLAPVTLLVLLKMGIVGGVSGLAGGRIADALQSGNFGVINAEVRFKLGTKTVAEKLIELRQKLVDLGDKDAEKTKKLNDEMTKVSKTMNDALLVEERLFNLRVKGLRTSFVLREQIADLGDKDAEKTKKLNDELRKRDKASAQYLFNQLQIQGALGNGGAELFKQLELYEQLTRRQKKTIVAESQILDKRRASGIEGAKLVEIQEELSIHLRNNIAKQIQVQEKYANIVVTLKEMNSELLASRRILESLKFELSLQKTRDEITSIREDLDKLPRELQTIITVSLDQARQRNLLAGIQENIESTFNEIDDRIDVIIAGSEELGKSFAGISEAIKTRNIEELNKLLDEAKQLTEKGEDGAKKVVAELSKAISVLKERETLQLAIEKSLDRQAKITRDITKEVIQLRAENQLIGVEFNKYQKAQLDVIRSMPKIVALVSKIAQIEVELVLTVGDENKQRELQKQLIIGQLSLQQLELENEKKLLQAIIGREKELRKIREGAGRAIATGEVQTFKDVTKARAIQGERFDPRVLARQEAEIRAKRLALTIATEAAIFNERMAAAKRGTQLEAKTRLDISNDVIKINKIAKEKEAVQLIKIALQAEQTRQNAQTKAEEAVINDNIAKKRDRLSRVQDEQIKLVKKQTDASRDAFRDAADSDFNKAFKDLSINAIQLDNAHKTLAASENNLIKLRKDREIKSGEIQNKLDEAQNLLTVKTVNLKNAQNDLILASQKFKTGLVDVRNISEKVDAVRLEAAKFTAEQEIIASQDRITAIKGLVAAELSAATQIADAGKRALNLFKLDPGDLVQLQFDIDLLRPLLSGAGVDPGDVHPEEFAALGNIIDKLGLNVKIFGRDLGKEIARLQLDALEGVSKLIPDLSFGGAAGKEDRRDVLSGLPETVREFRQETRLLQESIRNIRLEEAGGTGRAQEVFKKLIEGFQATMKSVESPITDLAASLEKLNVPENIVVKIEDVDVDVTTHFDQEFINVLREAFSDKVLLKLADTLEAQGQGQVAQAIRASIQNTSGK